jgi:hypothetical protein
MLSLVRDELIQRMDSQFADVRGQMDKQFAVLRASHLRMEILFEEQNANNRIVLEGLQALWQRQDRIEARPR